MKYDTLTRRHFLQGLGGSLMALPILPSLLPHNVYAQAVEQQKFLAIVNVDHGGAGFSRDWFPREFINNIGSQVFSTQNIIGTGGQNASIPHTIRHARLRSLLATHPEHDAGNVDNGQARLSYCLGAFLNPYLDKMNMFVGVDGGMTYYGHSRGVSAGSFHGVEERMGWPTVDHFLANSNRFYQNRESISTPILNVSPYSYTAQAAEYPNTAYELSGIYRAVFSRYQGTQDPVVVSRQQRRSFLIDRVLEDYNRLINGRGELARKISSTDRTRLNQHAEHMFETERKFRTVINTCSDVGAPNHSGYDGFWTPYYSDPRFNPNTTNPQRDYERMWDALTDLVAAAFSCGATNIANLQGEISAFLYAGDYHDAIVHQHENSRNSQLTHCRNIRWQAENLFGAIVRKLDQVDAGNGQTLLDQGLVVFSHEAGYVTHSHNSLGLVTAGSAGGFFNTGNFVDYRNLLNLGLLYDYWEQFRLDRERPGIPAQRFWANVLQAFGHSPSDYRRNNQPGYGRNQSAPSYNGTRQNPQRHVPYPVEITRSLDDRLPIVA